MDYPNYFADAETNYKESKYILFGVPYDKTSSFRYGASEGPKKIREASWNFETYNLITGFDLKNVSLHDYGDINVTNDNPDIMIEKVKEVSTKIIKNYKFPIVIGGEHSITTGIIKAFPDDIAVVSLDAHMDFRDTYENDKNNHACVIRRISEHLDINNIAVLGVRSAEKEEFLEAKKQGLFYIDSFKIKEEGLIKSLNEIIKYLKNKKIYLTLDIDVIDPAFAPGTSTPEPFGLSSLEILECIKFFSPMLVGFDIVEVCPKYDTGQTSLLSAKYIRYLLEYLNSRTI